MSVTNITWHKLEQAIDGDLQIDDLTKAIYATDASVYRRIPLGAVFPKHTNDIQTIVKFALGNQLSLIPRTAGTSLAGQCVGAGLVVDVSRYLTNIVCFDADNKTVTVQPGVIRDDLNRYLEPYGLFFGPNTSTSNRCMIGGMVGNNSSGTTSIQYGVTRDKVITLKTVLSDGSTAVFDSKNKKELEVFRYKNSLESKIYKTIDTIFSEEKNRAQIKSNYPKASIHRRNTGYALDVLLQNSFYDEDSQLNLCKLLCGSEGTLAFTTEITLKLEDLPPKFNAMICPHFTSIKAAMQAVAPAMQHQLYTCELMDKTILDCTKKNKSQAENRFFVEGDPKGILMLELRAHTKEELNQQIASLQDTLNKDSSSYASPVLFQEDTFKALELRKAGLGLLGNIVGDRKAVACIEDTAVALEDLAAYIEEFSKLMDDFDQDAVYYAHAGAGEIHLRPILNLKLEKDVRLFEEITDAVASLVKKYNGSMSGEHGDGIVRSKYIPEMIGAENYELLQQIKQVFDPYNIFNPGKIVASVAMTHNLRYEPDREEPKVNTLFDFSDSEGILRAAEKCNGSGDCRKSVAAGGGMCPSYRATNNEKDTTRARANALREVLTNSSKINQFDSKILKQAFDLCVSCKACASECPSNVDVATLKSEFLYQYHKLHPHNFRDYLFGYNNQINKWLALIAPFTNWVMRNGFTASIIKKSVGVASKRSLPQVTKQPFNNWLINYLKENEVASPIKELYLFVDEFTNFLEPEIGKDTVKLLSKLNYKIHYLPHKESGRALISKGFLAQAKKVANENIAIFKSVITDETPLVGIEPSAILTFRDEYARLANDKQAAEKLASNVFTLEEFLTKEYESNRIQTTQFTQTSKEVKVHVHCQQKSISNTQYTFQALNIPSNYQVKIINSGCCGMAGSFGYEAEHYEVSMQMGELSLLPKVRKYAPETIICVTGTSCRQQIEDGAARKAVHPATVLFQALK